MDDHHLSNIKKKLEKKKHGLNRGICLFEAMGKGGLVTLLVYDPILGTLLLIMPLTLGPYLIEGVFSIIFRKVLIYVIRCNEKHQKGHHQC
jgi:hypothetical protein